MTEQEIIKGNKVIAEFMEWTIEIGMENDVNPFYNLPYKKGFIPQMTLLSAMRYHASWDWLMPVVEKIQSIDISPAPDYRGYRIEIVPQGYVKIEGFPMPTITTNVSIEGGLMPAIYKAVVEFIKWYNQNKQS